ncbi:MAG: ROK family protein [Nanoarchaeota archaeon]|nr:ROK family protein [Nanoarchaeota archaeon]
MSKIIAVDLGGTNLRAALVKDNKILKYIKKKTPKNKNDLLREMVDSIFSLMTEDVKAIGVGSPGPLKNGIIQNPPNLPFRNFNLKKYLELQFKKRVVIENDAKCVAIAEANLGCRKKNFIILTLGTGIGGGIIINGKLYKGDGNAGELGHIILDNGKDFETCWKEKGKKIKELFENNEKEKLQIVSKYLGQGIGSLINVFDPEIVIIAGGIRENGNKFLNMIKKEVKKYQIIPRNVEIKFSKLEHPGILGANLLVR